MIRLLPNLLRHVDARSSSTNPSVFVDPEFGAIPYRRVAGSRYVRIKLGTNGKLRATLPFFAGIKSIGKLVDESREQLRSLVEQQSNGMYRDGQRIGHSHTLRFIANRNQTLKGSVSGQIITITHPVDTETTVSTVQEVVREYIARALRSESQAYLPRRLAYLAEKGGFSYKRVRFAHQSGRWGSCSSSGTISLNISLMMLPLELVDYVLVHELAHTKQMNHSAAFWSVVGDYYPNYVHARKILKTHNPYL